MSSEEVAEFLDIDINEVTKIERLILKSEFKRHQGVPGPKINNVTLSTDRKYPILRL